MHYLSGWQGKVEPELERSGGLNSKLVKEKSPVTKENPIVIEDREELIYMLSEALALLYCM